MRTLILSFTVALLLSSCAASSANYYTSSVQSWRGGHIDALTKQWGRPDYRVNGLSGTTLAYKTESYGSYVGPTSPQIGVNATDMGRPVIVMPQRTNNTWNRGTLSINCTVVFTADKKGIITNTKIIGQGCYGGEAFAKKYTNPST